MRDTEGETETQAEGEKQAPPGEPDAGLDPRTLASCPEPKADAQPLSHPGAWQHPSRYTHSSPSFRVTFRSPKGTQAMCICRRRVFLPVGTAHAKALRWECGSRNSQTPGGGCIK